MPSLSVIKKILQKEKIVTNLSNIQYFNNLPRDKTVELLNKKVVTCDFNKKKLMYMSDRDENIYQYTNVQYAKEYHQYKIQKCLNRVNRNHIDDSSYYASLWNYHLNLKKISSGIINNIISLYGNDIIIIVGDMSSSGNEVGIINWLLNVLAKEFTLYKINEFNTTIINCRSFERNQNMIACNGSDQYTLNSVFLYTCSNGRQGCINRDRNAVVNMIYIVDYWIELYLFLQSVISSADNMKTIDDHKLICSDYRLHNFLKNTIVDEENVSQYLYNNGRPLQFI
jgi:hypothetical protein